MQRKKSAARMTATGSEATMGGTSESSKVRALQAMHEQKTRALMKSIDQLRKQVDTLKAQGKESRRTALIQTLRNEKRDQELIADVLKRELGAATGQSPAEVDAMVVKKTLGGPKRFRPKSREELSLEIRRLKTELGRAARKHSRSGAELSMQQASSGPDVGQNCDGTTDNYEKDPAEAEESKHGAEAGMENSRQVANEPEQPAGNRPRIGELLARIEDLQVELVARERSSKAYVDIIDGLRREVRELHAARDKLDRMSEKQGRLKQTVRDLQAENVELAHEKENLEEEIRQLESNQANLRGELQHHANTEQSSTAARTESLELLETVKDLKAREMTMMDEMDSLRMQLAEAKQRIFSSTQTAQENERLAQEQRALADNLAAERRRADLAERRVEKLDNVRIGLEDKLADKEDQLLKARAEAEAANEAAEAAAATAATAIAASTAKPAFGDNYGGDEAFASEGASDAGSAREEKNRDSARDSLAEVEEERDRALLRCKTAEEALRGRDAAEGALEMLARVQISRANERVRELEIRLDSSRKQTHELQREKRRLREIMKKSQEEYRRRVMGILEQRDIRSAVESEVLRRDGYLNERLIRLDAEVQRKQAAADALQLALERVLAHARILHARLDALAIRDCPPLPNVLDVVPQGPDDEDSNDDADDDDDDDVMVGDQRLPHSQSRASVAKRSEKHDEGAAVYSEADEDDL